MKITEQKALLDPQLGGPGAIQPEGGGRRGPEAGAVPAAGDRVSVSAAARSLAGLRLQAGEVDAVREERVAALRAAVDGGHYRVDPQVVAGSVLRELLTDALV